MSFLYTPKTIVITGATSGFGYETAKAFASNFDCRLILTGRRLERLEELKEELGVPTHIIQQDVRDTDQVTKDFTNLPTEFQEVDFLLNNAGLALGGEPLSEKPLEDSLQMVETNISGLLAVTHALLPGMVDRKRGHIINIGSLAGHFPYPTGNAYCGSKAFVNHFSLALRADLKGKNIRVTSLEPGAVETEFSVVRFKGDKEKADAVYAGYRKMTASDIAEIILWLATQPEHVNVNSLLVTPTDQSFGMFTYDSID